MLAFGSFSDAKVGLGWQYGYTELEEEEEYASPGAGGVGVGDEVGVGVAAGVGGVGRGGRICFPWATLAGSLALCSDGFALQGVTDGSDSLLLPLCTNYYQDGFHQI